MKAVKSGSEHRVNRGVTDTRGSCPDSPKVTGQGGADIGRVGRIRTRRNRHFCPDRHDSACLPRKGKYAFPRQEEIRVPGDAPHDTVGVSEGQSLENLRPHKRDGEGIGDRVRRNTRLGAAERGDCILLPVGIRCSIGRQRIRRGRKSRLRCAGDR